MDDLNRIAEQLQNPNRTVRYRAIYSLSKIDDPRAMELLARTVRADRDHEVRAMATKLLRKFGAHQIVRPLTKALLEDRNAQVRRAAAETLGTLAFSAPEIENALIDALYDRSKVVRRAAIQSLRIIESTDAVSDLIGVMLADSDGYVRYEAAQTLALMAPLSAISAFIEALDADENSYVRYTAAHALGQFYESDAIVGPLSDALLNDENSHVRYAAGQSLGSLLAEGVYPEIVRVLLRALDDSDSQVWHVAAESLWDVADEAIPIIIGSLLSNDKRMRAAALKAMLWLSAEYDDDYAPDMIDTYEATTWGWWN